MKYYVHIECIGLPETLLNYKGYSKITNGKDKLLFSKCFDILKDAEIESGSIIKDELVIDSSLWKSR